MEVEVADLLWIGATVLWTAWWPASFVKLLKEKDSTGQSVIAWVAHDIAEILAVASGVLWQKWSLAGSSALLGTCGIVMTVLVMKYRRKR